MSEPLRDDAFYRTRQAWIRTGLGAAAVCALAVRAALLGTANALALIAALTGVIMLIGAGVRGGRQAHVGRELRRREAWLVTLGIVLLGTSGALLALMPN